uniref:Serpentine receptor class gamma n=1 Tax=Panagrellus redivivus TaxID=6233 RepID=A0A7E4UTZ2_PANRE
MYVMTDDCMKHYTSMTVAVEISTVCASGISVILIAVAIRKSKSYFLSSTGSKIEKRMILHAAVASWFLLLWVATVYLSNAILSMYKFFDNLSFFIFFLQHYPPMLLILWIKYVLWCFFMYD